MPTMRRMNEDRLRMLRVSTVSAGTKDHDRLSNRDLADQHPMSAITGLSDALEEKADAVDVSAVKDNIADIEDVLGTKADIADVPTELYAVLENGIVTLRMR